MKYCKLVVVFAFVAPTLLAGGTMSRVITFGKNAPGKVPAGWTVAKTGKSQGSEWKVVADETAPSKSGRVLAQTAESPAQLFNLCIVNEGTHQNVEVSVAFKAVKGEVDQGGGIVWRYLDANNYYVARMNPMENNFRLYKVVAGKRMQLESKGELKVPVGTWHTLKIRQMGDKITCFLDDAKHLEASDDTFTKAGKVGLWTKADAQTYFDNFTIRKVE